MKNIIYILTVMLVFGCQKEDALKPNLEIERLYTIEDDPSDAVKHRVYEIYTEYGVPVYFNDTIGRIFVKEDMYGDSVYRYETIDMAWGFTSYASLTYKYEYMDSSEERQKALDIIENYLKQANKALYPFNFFVVKAATTKDVQKNEMEYNNGAYVIGTRSILMTGDWDEENVEELPETMKKEMVKKKIGNYSNLLTAFYNVSKGEWYETKFDNLDPFFYSDIFVWPNNFGYMYGNGIPPNYYFTPNCFEDSWYATEEFSPEGLENFRAAYRKKIGQFGFVSSEKWGGNYTPETTEHDLEFYISEMLRWSPEKFHELWGESPLVIRKYNILYEILVDKLGVEL